MDKAQQQVIARGVTAGVVSIKQLGTNGGGYFGPNSAHPYENPTPLSNLIEIWSITVIPMAMVVMLGDMVGRRRVAVVIFVVMLAIYLPISLIMSLWLLQPVKGAVVGLQWALRMHGFGDGHEH